jgi:hypothetical protein
LHRLQSGALLLFTFFMISDPKTTPDSRAGRVVFAALVAFGAWYVQFRLFRTNGLLWSLALWSAAVPLIDRLLPGRRYAWQGRGLSHACQRGLKTPPLQQDSPSWARGLQTPGESTLERILSMKRIVTALALATLIIWSAPAVIGFCGFYVAKADTKLFNRASQVVLVRDGDRTVLTMANDYQGSLKEFAVVVRCRRSCAASRSTSVTARSSIISTPIRRRGSSSISTPTRAGCWKSHRWRPPRRAGRGNDG